MQLHASQAAYAWQGNAGSTRQQGSSRGMKHGTAAAPPAIEVAVATRSTTSSSGVFRGAIKPSLVRRLRSTGKVVHMLSIHIHESTPRLVCTALCHLANLVEQEGQSISDASLRQLHQCLTQLVTPQRRERFNAMQQQQQQQQLPPQQDLEQLQQQEQQHDAYSDSKQQSQQAAVAIMPLSQYSARDIATLLWVLARLRVRLHPPERWEPFLAAIMSVNSQLSPRDASLVAWALAEMAAAPPAGWSQMLLDTQADLLPSYPTQSAVLLLHSAVRLRARLPSSCHQPLLAALQPRLQHMSSQQLSMLLWSLSLLGVSPPTAFMQAVMAAATRQLPAASWPEVASLMTAVARISFVPPGSWLLGLYDQLYWTVDQLQLRQLAQLVWALGRLRLGGAVPRELLERVFVFAEAEARPALAAAAAAAGDGHCGTGAAADRYGTTRGNDAAAAVRNQLSKQLCALLCGLAGLRMQLSAAQQQVCCEWLEAVLGLAGSTSTTASSSNSSSSSSSYNRSSSNSNSSGGNPGGFLKNKAAASRRVPAVLKSAVLLRLQPHQQQQQHILDCLEQLRPHMSHWSLAVGLWAAVELGCRPSQPWLQQWLAASEPLLLLSGFDEIIMLLTACARLGTAPPGTWLAAALVRMCALVRSASGRNIVASLRWLLLLGLGPAIPGHLQAAMSSRMEQLEMASRVSGLSQQRFYDAMRELRRQQQQASSSSSSAAAAAAAAAAAGV